jgi:hypothetical protein
VTVNSISRGLIASGTIQQMLQDMVKNQGRPTRNNSSEKRSPHGLRIHSDGGTGGAWRAPEIVSADSRWSNQDWRVFAKEVAALHLRDSHEDLKRMEERSEQVPVLPSSRTVPGRRANAVALRLILPWTDRGLAIVASFSCSVCGQVHSREAFAGIE